MTVSVLLIAKAPFPTHTVFTDLEEATTLVASLQKSDEDGWNYLLNTSEDGKKHVIEVYDETGYLLGLL